MSTSTTPVPSHPFANSKGLLVVIPQDHVDVEEESAFYEEFEQQNFGVRFLISFCNILNIIH